MCGESRCRGLLFELVAAELQRVRLARVRSTPAAQRAALPDDGFQLDVLGADVAGGHHLGHRLAALDLGACRCRSPDRPP